MHRLPSLWKIFVFRMVSSLPSLLLGLQLLGEPWYLVGSGPFLRAVSGAFGEAIPVPHCMIHDIGRCIPWAPEVASGAQ